MKKLMIAILILIPIVLLLVVKLGMIIVVSSEIIPVESITITTADGEIVDQDTKIYNLLLDTDSASVQLGSTILPTQATDQSCTYSIISGDDIATITDDGLLTAVWYGDVVVKVITTSGSSDVITINVYDDYSHEVNIVLPTKLLYVGDTDSVSGDIIPTETINKTINWTSSNSNIVTIDAVGNIVAKSTGTVTLTATMADTGVTDSVEVVVYQYVTSVTAITSQYLIAEDSIDLSDNYTVAPSSADNIEILYHSSDSSIATVDSYGVVTFVKAGSVDITIMATSQDYVDADGNDIYVTSVVSVTSTYGYANSITFVEDTISIDYVSQQILYLSYTTVPSVGVNSNNIAYSTSDSSVIAIINGMPTIVGGGWATITIYVVKPDGTQATDTVRVQVNRVAESFTILVEGSSITSNYFTTTKKSVSISALYLPDDATNKGLVISSTDNKSTVDSYAITFDSGYGLYSFTAACGDVQVIFTIYYQDSSVDSNTVEPSEDGDNATLSGVDYEDSFYIATDKAIASIKTTDGLSVDPDTLEVVALSGGSHTITITYTDGTTEDVDIFVTRYATNFSVAVDGQEEVDQDSSTATIYSAATGFSVAVASWSTDDVTQTDVVYTSSNTDIATVDSDGIVTFHQSGTVIITITIVTASSSSSGITYMSRVVNTSSTSTMSKTVTIRSTYGELEYAYITTDDVYQDITSNTVQLQYDIVTAADYTFAFSSSNTAIATVDSNGLVTFSQTGWVTITLTVSIGDIQLTDTVKVYVRQIVTDFDIKVGGNSSTNDYFVVTSSSVVVSAQFSPTDMVFDPSLVITSVGLASVYNNTISFDDYGIYQFTASIDGITKVFYIYYTNSRYSTAYVQDNTVELEYNTSYYLYTDKAIADIDVVSGQFEIASDMSIKSMTSGESTITITYVDNTQQTITVNTIRYATGFTVSVDGQSSTDITTAKVELDVVVSAWSSDDVTQKTVLFESSDSAIASIDQYGTITFNKAGSVIITISIYTSSTDMLSKTVEITSTFGAVQSFTVSSSSLAFDDIGDTQTISITTIPSDYDATADWAVPLVVSTSDYFTFDSSTMTITAVKAISTGTELTISIGSLDKTVSIIINKLVEGVSIQYSDNALEHGATYYTFVSQLTLSSAIINSSSSGTPTNSTVTWSIVGDNCGATLVDGILTLPDSYDTITVSLSSADGNATTYIYISAGSDSLFSSATFVEKGTIYAPSNDDVEIALDITFTIDDSYILGAIDYGELLEDIVYSGESVSTSYSIYGNLIINCLSSTSNNTTTITAGSSVLTIQWYYLSTITLSYSNTNDSVGYEQIRVFGNLWFENNETDDLDSLTNSWYIPFTTNLPSTITDTSSIIYWTSSDTSIATVDSNGMITVLKYGTGTDYSVTVTITATSYTDSTVYASYTFIFVEGINIYSDAQFDRMFENKDSKSYSLTYYNVVLHSDISMVSHATINNSYITSADQFVPYRFEDGEAIYGNGYTINSNQVYLDAIWLHATFNGESSAYYNVDIGGTSVGLVFAGNNLVTNVNFEGYTPIYDDGGTLNKTDMQITTGDKTYNGATTSSFNARWAFYSGYTIQYCKFSYSAYGVAIQNAASGSISNTAILHNGSYGLIAYGGDIYLTDVVIADAGVYGICIDASDDILPRLFIDGFLDIYNINTPSDYSSIVQTAMESFFTDSAFEDFVIEYYTYSSGWFSSGWNANTSAYQANMTIVYLSDDGTAVPSSGVVYTSDGSGGWVDVDLDDSNSQELHSVDASYTLNLFVVSYNYTFKQWGYYTDVGENKNSSTHTPTDSDHYIQPDMEYSDSLYKLYRSYSG